MSVDYRIFKREEIAAHLDINSLIEPMVDAYKSISSGRVRIATDVLHPSEHSDIHIKSAVLDGADIFVVKTAGWSATNEGAGYPASSGMITVFDAKTCHPIAILQDEHLISDLRTAAAGAVAATALANPEITTVGVLGAGEQAYLQTLALCQVRSPDNLRIWNRNKRKAERMAQRLAKLQPNLNIQIDNHIQAVVESSDVLICATAAKQPLIEAEWLKPGVHITSVGADDSNKCEVGVDCLKRADIVAVDSREVSRQFGNIHRAMQQGFSSEENPLFELGEILNSQVPARTSAEQITIATLVGLGAQDLAAVAILKDRLGFG